jgi:hypothetical protein
MFKGKVGRYFSEDAARELVTHYFDALPLAIASTAASEIKKSQMHTEAYHVVLKTLIQSMR